MKYVKKPIPIDAWQIEDVSPTKGVRWVPDWVVESKAFEIIDGVPTVDTLEGRMTGNIGDYLIRGIRGELYICEKSIFEESYELVSEEDVTNDDSPSLSVDDIIENDDGSAVIQMSASMSMLKLLAAAAVRDAIINAVRSEIELE